MRWLSGENIDSKLLPSPLVRFVRSSPFGIILQRHAPLMGAVRFGL